MPNYEELNDYELVDAAQEFNEDAIELLHQKYKQLIVKKCRQAYNSYKNSGFSLSDLILECTLSFDEAIHKFLPDEAANFYTFVNVCLDRTILTFLRGNLREKNKILNESISLELDNEDSTSLLDVVPDNSKNPDCMFEDKENIDSFCECLINELTSLEESVFRLKIQSFTYKEIADILDKDKKAIDNAVQRIKVKIIVSLFILFSSLAL